MRLGMVCIHHKWKYCPRQEIRTVLFSKDKEQKKVHILKIIIIMIIQERKRGE